MRGIRALSLLGAALVLYSGHTAGATPRRQFSFEANPFRGTIGLCARFAPDWQVGGDAGFGFPQFDRTLAPKDGDFLDIVHIGGLARYSPPGPANLDLGLRMGLADLHACTSGDCFPGLYVGFSAGLFVGWSWVRFGPRMIVARFAQQGERTSTVVSVAPVNVGLYYTW
jgi:hypothetical protein